MKIKRLAFVRLTFASPAPVCSRLEHDGWIHSSTNGMCDLYEDSSDVLAAWLPDMSGRTPES